MSGNELAGAGGGRKNCYFFYEDLMNCIKQEGIHRVKYKCRTPREDYLECVRGVKASERMEAIKKQRAKLIKEGKWPPKE